MIYLYRLNFLRAPSGPGPRGNYPAYPPLSTVLAIAIDDNNDFKSDTLTSAGQSHHTNVMFVQPESFDRELSSENHWDRPVPGANLASSLSTTLKELGSEMQKFNPPLIGSSQMTLALLTHLLKKQVV